MQSSLVIPTVSVAFGMFLLSIGTSALKVAHLGIRYLPVEWIAAATTLSYRTVGYSLAITGFGFTLIAAEICRRADKRIIAGVPGMASPTSFRFTVLPGAFVAFLGWLAVDTWLQKNI